MIRNPLLECPLIWDLTFNEKYILYRWKQKNKNK
ncbi:MAG: hypothetical protein ACD_80C00134G0003 [uncultured bacterium (gcode 4)]|uniref:Uncharacterized protein n=1 Tax=uncultured bacterium (gcode 4) TaxID=1234023 RepID=K1XX73_9BACT|nr:MAG: hypothetical protein ACD_80C00134G0003 [uncultured bacterium (gcode 4)]